MNVTASWETLTASWGVIKPWLPIALPMLLPKAVQYYKSYNQRPASIIRPLPKKTSYALWLLLAAGSVALISILFGPDNVFLKTDSFPHTPGSMILHRLRKLGEVTAADERLCHLLDDGGKWAARLYATYGPDVLDNPLARPDEIDSKRWYLLYAAPSIIAPHLAHLLVLGIATSGMVSGKEGASWRSWSILAGLAVAGMEIYLIETYDLAASMRGARARDVSYMHWQVKIWRGVAIAVMDVVLGWMMWLQATGRAFVVQVSPVEKLAENSRLLLAVASKVGTLGVLHTGTMRTADLRRKVDDYWIREQEALADMLEQPEVAQAQRNVLAKKDMGAMRKEVAKFVDGIVTRANNSPA